MKQYTFRECTRAKLEDMIGLRNTLTSPVLDDWLEVKPDLSSTEKDVLETFQEALLLNGDSWNEQELSLYFIGPIFSLVRFTELYRFKLFAERHIQAIVSGNEEDIELKGEPDGLIATGYWEPKIPMFAFSEYKRNLDPNGDPAGQTLAAMLVGQVLNTQPNLIYGCYVIGANWHFMVLQGEQYTISRSYSAQTDEIFDIFWILKALKLIIMDLTAE